MGDVKTLRDEIAISALQGLIADNGSERPAEYLAKDAYDIADAMIKERNKNG